MKKKWKVGKCWISVLAVCFDEFDGASTMSGSIGGVQGNSKEQNLSIQPQIMCTVMLIV